jgi:hypothetical protein
MNLEIITRLVILKSLTRDKYQLWIHLSTMHSRRAKEAVVSLRGCMRSLRLSSSSSSRLRKLRSWTNSKIAPFSLRFQSVQCSCQQISKTALWEVISSICRHHQKILINQWIKATTRIRDKTEMRSLTDWLRMELSTKNCKTTRRSKSYMSFQNVPLSLRLRGNREQRAMNLLQIGAIRQQCLERNKS